ncbi:hypothetical protein [Maricaulis sp.]|uniref:hypothetical protein n=1 Tax=Maricaulis sp. TaxID=1486257 RepID=UPI003A901C04
MSLRRFFMAGLALASLAAVSGAAEAQSRGHHAAQTREALRNSRPVAMESNARGYSPVLNIYQDMRRGFEQGVSVNQNGHNNGASLFQSGRNGTMSLQQYGNDLSANLYQNGDGNIVAVAQVGEGSTVNTVQEGNNNVLGVIQVGNGQHQTYTQVGDGNADIIFSFGW